MFRKIPGLRSVSDRWQDALVVNLAFKRDRNVFVFEDRTRFAQSLPSKADTTFDLLFLRGGIIGNALTEVADYIIDLFDFVAVDGGAFVYVLSELVVHNLSTF